MPIPCAQSGYCPGVIRVRRYLQDGRVEEEIDPSDVSECLGAREALLWVDVESPTADDVACLAAVVASGRIGLEAGRLIRAHLERKPRDVEPLPRGCPTRENAHKRAPSLSGILARLLAKYFEKNRAGGACFDVFRVAMDGFSE